MGTRLTKALVRLARAVALLPYVVQARAVHEGRVLVADVVEEVDLVFAREERRTDAVDGGVSPALLVARHKQGVKEGRCRDEKR